MLQNRVDPLGEIHAVPERGLLMGNRGGPLHGADRRLGPLRWRSKAWIACVLSFKGIRRQVMAPGRYTELFFLDEATALAAGHRPCAECRRPDYERFRDAWVSATGMAKRPLAGAMDAVLHAERVDPTARGKRLWDLGRHGLAAGSMVQDAAGTVWLVRADDRLRRWSFAGYREERRPVPGEALRLVTPPSIEAALQAGYCPGLHPSAG